MTGRHSSLGGVFLFFYLGMTSGAWGVARGMRVTGALVSGRPKVSEEVASRWFAAGAQ